MGRKIKMKIDELEKQQNEKAERAHEEYRFLQRKTNRPPGCFGKNGYWIPKDIEIFSCCLFAEQPHWNTEDAYLTHQRTPEHIAHKYDVSVDRLEKLIEIDNTLMSKNESKIYKLKKRIEEKERYLKDNGDAWFTNLVVCDLKKQLAELEKQI